MQRGHLIRPHVKYVPVVAAGVAASVAAGVAAGVADGLN